MKTKNKGITLIALVITIITLLILAGITIAQLTGSGLFENARLAKERSDEAQKKEQGILADYENALNGYLSGTTRNDEWVTKTEYEQLLAEVQALKTDLQESNKKISALEDETIVNKRIDLMSSSPIDIPATTTWTEWDFANIELSDSVENYKYLEINTVVVGTDTNYYDVKTTFIAIEELTYNNSNTSNWYDSSIFTFDGNDTGFSFITISCWLKDNKTFHVGGIDGSTNGESLRILNIYGIK